MQHEAYESLKSRFLKVYAALPEPERFQVIAVLEGKTYAWNVAFSEIQNDTDLGKKILKKMEELKIL